MPQYKKPGSGRDFKPGQSGNPNGRKPLPKELKEAKKINATMFQEAVNKLAGMTMQALKEYVSNGSPTMLEMAIVGQLKAATSGKTSPLAFLCDRTIGPVQQQFKVQVDGGISVELDAMTEEQKKKYLEEIRSGLTQNPA